MVAINKRFGNVIASDNADFELLPGEVHGLLGENGAGKTSLMNVLFGLYHPDSGEIFIQGQPVIFQSGSDAIRMGIGMVHQSFRNIPTLTVTENIILGLPSQKTYLNLEQPAQRIFELSERYHLGINPKAFLWQLSAGEQQRVEILKALYRNARILILDEPTSVLTPSETQGLFLSIEKMIGEGHGVVFISHKLGEVMRICHRITVMCDGKTVATVNKSQISQENLACMMVGREVNFQLKKPVHEPGNILLRLEGVCIKNEAGQEALKNVSLDLRCGEILGIAGVAGNGQSELSKVITGLQPCISGEILFKDEKINGLSPQEMIQRGIAHIPEKPREMGVLPNFTIEENTALKVHGQRPFRWGWFLNTGVIGARADALMEKFDVRAPNRQIQASKLSGGNLNKLILAGELCRNPDLIIAVNPTAGLDVGATEYIHKHLLEQRTQDKAILLISSDLEEVLGLSDRIAVIYQGKLSPGLDANQVTHEEIGLLMAGGQANAKHIDMFICYERKSSSPEIQPGDTSFNRRELITYHVPNLNDRLRHILNPKNLLDSVIDRSGWESFLGALFSIGLSLLIVGFLIALMGISPFQAYEALWRSAFGTRAGFGETIVRATPILLTGLAMVVAYRCGIWSIGAEGQLYFGAIGASVVGILHLGIPSSIHILLVLAAGFLFGAAYGALPGLMLVYRNANELITTMMLNYLAIFFAGSLITGNGPLRDTSGIKFRPQSLPIADSAHLPLILPGTRAHAGILIALLAALVVFVLLWKTVAGYRIRAVGDNPVAARFGGIHVPRSIILAMAISGGLAGIAGMIEVTGVQGYLVEMLSADYGYTGIAVALLGGLHPVGAVLTSLFFGALSAGASGLQRAVGVPTSTTLIIQGLVLMFVLARGAFRLYRRKAG